MAVQRDEKFGGDEGRALVAVHERMIADDPECVGGGQIRDIGRRLPISGYVLGTRKGGLKQRLVAEAVCAAMFRKLFPMNREDDLLDRPRPCHLANSRRALRRFFMILRAAVICASNAGLWGVSR